MFVVLFEVQPKRERFDDYLANARLLRPELVKIEGFIDNNRFASRRTEGRLLSLSTWRDEKAVIRWRTHGLHHEVQERGRFEIFQNYHLRVGEVVADSHIPPAESLREQRFDATTVGTAKLVTITELSLPKSQRREIALADRESQPDVTIDAAGDPIQFEIYDDIARTGAVVILTSWREAADVVEFEPRIDWKMPSKVGPLTVRRRRVRVIRDYGMHDRREAPQFYPPVPNA